VVDSIFSLELRILEMSSFDVRNAIEISQRVNISPYDCVHVAVMQHAEIGEIVSADKDFDRVPGIRRRDPKAFSAT
jgi:predicted nucleic acid-binding protein